MDILQSTPDVLVLKVNYTRWVRNRETGERTRIAYVRSAGVNGRGGVYVMENGEEVAWGLLRMKYEVMKDEG